jgi:hypothetical protein
MYDPATDSWNPMLNGGQVPTPRVYHSTIWTGSKMIVFGGGALGTEDAFGGQYN